MSYGWRGVVGLVLPTYRPGSLLDLIRWMPEGIGVIPLYVGVRSGTDAEFKEALQVAAERIAQLAGLGVDVIVQMGSPPMMLLGYSAETELVNSLAAKYGKPILTSARSQADAARALGIRRLLGVTYFPEEMNRKFARYFEDAGVGVVAMLSYPIPFVDAGKVMPQELDAFMRKAFLEHKGADGLFIMGGGWHPSSIFAPLERDLGLPLVASPTAELWAIMKQLQVRGTIHGFGKLLEGV